VQRLARIHAQTAQAQPPAPRRAQPLPCCTITHVTAPSKTAWLHGARMSYFSAILPISDGMGLVFAVSCYDGRIVVSPTSCRELMPDPQFFTQCVRDSFQEFLALARADGRPARTAAARASASGRARPSARTARSAATRPPAGPAGRRRSTAPRR